MNEPDVVFPRCFYIKRYSFSRTMFWYHQSFGGSPFSVKKFKIHENFKSFFCEKSFCRLSFSMKDRFCWLPNIQINRKMMPFLFILESAMLSIDLMNAFWAALKTPKNDKFSKGAPVMQLVTPSERSDRANILGFVFTIHDLHFKIVKSKILLRTSCPVFWWTIA